LATLWLTASAFATTVDGHPGVDEAFGIEGHLSSAGKEDRNGRKGAHRCVGCARLRYARPFKKA